jgi:Mg/Co/Ni transporter MgtE
VTRCYGPGMARTSIDEAAGMTVGEVVHRRFSALPATATVGEVREWFAVSTSRRMAFLADDGRYAGSLTPSDLDGDADRPAAEVAHDGPTVDPEASVSAGYQLALATDARRVPVVDAERRLLGVLSVTEDQQGFCGTG